MEKGMIVRFAPELLGAIKEALGRLPSFPGDLAKMKALTIYSKHTYAGEPGWIYLDWIELAPGHFFAVGLMENLHTLQFKNDRILGVRDFSFLSKLKKLKKLDLSGTNFSDCRLLQELPALQHAILPDRRGLVHTEVLAKLSARVEPEPEKEERERCRGLYEAAAVSEGHLADGTYTADARLVSWIAASLGGVPDAPFGLEKITCIDCLDCLGAEKVPADGSLPPWISIKEGDFSLLAKLPRLGKLFLWSSGLQDFSFLAECKQLCYINLWDTDFVDCRILADLPNLRCVCLPEKKKLKNFSVLKGRQAAEAAKIKEDARAAMYSESKTDTLAPTKRPLQIKIEPEYMVLSDIDDEEEPYYKIVEPLAGNRRKQQANSTAAGSTKVKTERDGWTAEKKETLFFREDEFDHLAVVRGEEAVISYQGSSKVRHIWAQFWMETELSPMWEKFLEMDEEEDNWAQFSAKKAQVMTDELVRLVAQGDVAALFLSLDSYGEGPYLTLEFAQGWAAINYMDDEDSVYYSIYNPLYPKAVELCPVNIGGQSPVPKTLAVEDLELTAKIVRCFLEKGQLLPGTLWKTNQDIRGKSEP